MVQTTKTVAIAIVAVIVFACSAHSASYYVSSSDGSDGDSGTTLNDAFRTVQRAVNVAQAGDNIFIRSGVYSEDVSITNSGTSLNKIVISSYNGENVLIRGTSSSTSCIRISGDYIVLDGLRIKHQNPCRAYAQTVGVFVWGDHAEIRDCVFVGNDAETEYSYPCRARETAIEIDNADYSYIHDNTIDEISFHGVRVQQNARYWSIQSNSIHNVVDGNGVMLMSEQSELQRGVIEDNVMWGSIISDCIQTNGNLDSFRPPPANWGVVIRNNTLYDAAENVIDLKGVRYYVVENNIIYGGTGNNDGTWDGTGNSDGTNDLYGGIGGIAHGNGQLSYDTIIRGNIIYDNNGGILAEDGYRIYNNTLINNDRDYSGPNSTLGEKFGISSYRPDIKIINNIFGGHRTCDVRVSTGYSSNYINNNLYTSDTGAPTLCDNVSGDYYQYSFSSWRTRCNANAIGGNDASSIVASPGFVDATSASSGSHVYLDFSLTPGSAAIDSGGALTTAVNSASNSSTLEVADGSFFSDGLGAPGVSGDHIMIDGVVAQITSKAGNTLYLDRSIAWQYGDGVVWCPDHQCPSDGQIDIGAVQYGDSADGGGGDGGDDEPVEDDPILFLSMGSPSGNLPSGTTSAEMSVQTSNEATCKYSPSFGVAYESMPFTFSNTGSFFHSTNVSGLSSGNYYQNYIKCLDAYGQVSGDYPVSFSVSSGSGDALVNLIDGTTYSGDSGVFNTDTPPYKLWDGCWDSGCNAGSSSDDVGYVDFDLGASYDLSGAELFGDDEGNWVCTNWSIEHRNLSTDSWSTAFFESCNGPQWFYESLSGITARYLRVWISGDTISTYPAFQANELRVYGELTDTGDAPVPNKFGALQSRITHPSVGSSTAVMRSKSAAGINR